MRVLGRLQLIGVVGQDGVSLERIARSDECTAGLAVPGHQPGYAVPVHHRGRNTCFQIRKSLETKEDNPGSVDGTQDESGGCQTSLV